MGREDSIKWSYPDFSLVCASLAEEDIPFMHYQFFSCWRNVRAPPCYLKAAVVKMLQPNIMGTISIFGQFLFGAIISYLVKCVFHKLKHVKEFHRRSIHQRMT